MGETEENLGTGADGRFVHVGGFMANRPQNSKVILCAVYYMPIMSTRRVVKVKQ